MLHLKFLRPSLQQGLDALAIEVTEAQVDLLLQYLSLLEKWNRVYNLTAIKAPEEMLVKHLLDSLAILPHLTGSLWIDVGTGAGLPGVPLAILSPDNQIDLLDSNSKKTRFLTQVKAELGLNNTQVIHERVECYQPAVSYDGVISRAFASINDMLYWTAHLLSEEGYWWAMKSQRNFEDLAALSSEVNIQNIIELSVPGLEAERMLLKIAKLSG